jgi:hypothetical protein
LKMDGYLIKDCDAAGLVNRKGNGTYECRRLWLCPSKKFSGFRTLCEQGLLYEKDKTTEAKKPGARDI